jgi:hypothetical protein
MDTFKIEASANVDDGLATVNDRPLADSELEVVNGGFIVLYYAALGAGIGYAAAQIHNNW